MSLFLCQRAPESLAGGSSSATAAAGHVERPGTYRSGGSNGRPFLANVPCPRGQNGSAGNKHRARYRYRRPTPHHPFVQIRELVDTRRVRDLQWSESPGSTWSRTASKRRLHPKRVSRIVRACGKSAVGAACGNSWSALSCLSSISPCMRKYCHDPDHGQLWTPE